MDSKRLIIDIETLGVRPDSVVLQVELIAWDDNAENPVVAQRSWNLDGKQQQQSGRTIDYDTVLWWQNQSREATNSVFHNPGKTTKPLTFPLEFSEALRELTETGFKDVWANSPSFDLVILTDLVDPVTLDWSFRDWRDQRTLEAVYMAVTGRNPKVYFKDMVAALPGMPHTAPYDCMKSAKMIYHMIRDLKTLKQGVLI